MKNLVSIFAILLLSITHLLGQSVPELMNYQAVARDVSGNPLVNQAINVDFELRAGSSTGNAVYAETHSVTTNQFGLFTLAIGSGTVVSGNFSTIAWGSNTYYLHVTVNGDALGSTQLISVPYALYAKASGSGPSGKNSLSIITPIPSGGVCQNGGHQLDVGVDQNGNGTLEAGEISQTVNICNGDSGAPGVGINWLGTFGNAPTTPNLNDAYYNSNLGQSFIWDGLAWQIIAQDGNAGGYTGGTGINITGGTITNTGDLDSLDDKINNTVVVGNTIQITEGTTLHTINLASLINTNDTSATNELQTLSISGNTISINPTGNAINISATTPNTGEVLYWNGVNWISQLLPGNTDNQDLSNGGKSGNTQTINIQNGTGVTFSVADTDSSTTNELITNFDLNTTNDSLVLNEAGNHHAIPLSSFSDGDWNKGVGTVYNLTDDVGIGLNNPAYNFHVHNPNAGLVSLMSLTNNTTGTGVSDGLVIGVDNSGNSWIRNREATNLDFFTNNLTRATIDASGNFGINTTAPSTRLHVEGSTFLNGVTSIGGVSGLAATLKVFSGLGQTAYFFDSSSNHSLSVLASGNVTIGDQTDVSRLYIQDNNTNTTGSAGSFISIQNRANTAGTTSGIRFRSGGSTFISGDYHYKGAIYFQNTGGSNGEGRMIFSINNSATNSNVGIADAVMTLSNTGDVGIGTTTPNSKLDVQGHITMQDGNQQNGYIAVSDNNGLMTWTDPATLAIGSAWLYNGNDIYNGNSGNIGIGFNTPENLLHIRSNTGNQFKIGHNNQPTAEWIYDVNASGMLNIINENFGTSITAMSMNNLGRVGIGTTSPTSHLDVRTTSTERAAQFISNYASTTDKYGLYALAQGTGSGENIGVQGEASFATTNKAIVGRAFGGTNNWAGYFETGDVYMADNLAIGTTSIGMIAGATNYLTIASSGSYSAGSIASLELKGNVNGGNSSSAKIDFLNGLGVNNTARIEMRTSSSSTGEGQLLFYTNGGSLTEAMRINEDGEVGIGTSSPGTSLEVNGAITYTPTTAAAGNNTSYALTVGDRSYIRVTTSFGGATLGSISSGLKPGHFLIIENVGGYLFRIDDGAANLDIAGNALLYADDTITLIWTGSKWVEISRSDN